MRVPIALCFAASMLTGVCGVTAQEEATPTPRPTPPAPPFLNQTADLSAWTIVRYDLPGLGGQAADAVIHTAASATKPESLTSVTKTGRIRHLARKVKGGEQEDIWYERGNRVTMQSIWKIPMFEGDVSSAKLPQGPDFPELSWISAGNFSGTQEVQNTTYFVFETQVTEGSTALAKAYGYQLKSTFNRVYVNADTRMPWMLQTGDVLQRYVFQTPPTAQLEVPPEFQTMFDAYEKRKLETTKKPVAP